MKFISIRKVLHIYKPKIKKERHSKIGLIKDTINNKINFFLEIFLRKKKIMEKIGMIKIGLSIIFF